MMRAIFHRNILFHGNLGNYSGGVKSERLFLSDLFPIALVVQLQEFRCKASQLIESV